MRTVDRTAECRRVASGAPLAARGRSGPAKRRAALAVFGGLVLGAALPAVQAQPAAAVSLPLEVRSHLGPQARLRGSARLRWLGLSIYDARLWVGPVFEPQRYEAAPLALELIYARALKGPLIAERSIDEMRRAGPLAEDEARRWLSFMKEVFPDVVEGDRITGAWDPSDARSAFHVNGGAPRTLRDPAFGPRFFGIWLSPHSSQPAMRQQLLGLGA